MSQIEVLEKMLRKGSIEFIVSKSLDIHDILGCLEKIDKANVVYVVNPDGYVGKSVSIDIGYAYAKTTYLCYASNR